MRRIQQSSDALQTALRVFQALAKRRQPDPADIHELQRLAPLLADASPDELAGEVIMQALKRGDPGSSQ